MRMRDFHGLANGGLGVFRIPEIAFDIRHRRMFDNGFIDIVFGNETAGANMRRHRALRVRCHEHQTDRRGRAAVRWRRGKMHAFGMHIVNEHRTELVVAHLADEGAFGAKRGHARQRIGYRTAGTFAAGPADFIKLGRARAIDQRHAAFNQIFFGERRFIARHQHIDNRIADAGNVENYIRFFGHICFLAISRVSIVSTPIGAASTIATSMRIPASIALSCSSFSFRSSGLGGSDTNFSSALRR